MGGVSGTELPAGGGAMPTAAPQPSGGSGYAPPWAGAYAQTQAATPGLLAQQQAGPAPGGGLLAGSKAPQGDDETSWINAHLDQVIKAAQQSQQQKTVPGTRNQVGPARQTVNRQGQVAWTTFPVNHPDAPDYNGQNPGDWAAYGPQQYVPAGQKAQYAGKVRR